MNKKKNVSFKMCIMCIIYVLVLELNKKIMIIYNLDGNCKLYKYRKNIEIDLYGVIFTLNVRRKKGKITRS